MVKGFKRFLCQQEGCKRKYCKLSNARKYQNLSNHKGLMEQKSLIEESKKPKRS